MNPTGRHKFVTHVISIAFHVSRIVYLGAETLACILFRHARFFNKSSTRYGITVLQATNVALFLDIIFREAHERLHRHSPVNLTDDASSFYDDCTHGNLSFRANVVDKADAFLYPFPYEFSILVGECLAKWFTQCGTQTPHEVEGELMMNNRRHRGSQKEDFKLPIPEEYTVESRETSLLLPADKLPSFPVASSLFRIRRDRTQRRFRNFFLHPTKQQTNLVHRFHCLRRFHGPCKLPWILFLHCIPGLGEEAIQKFPRTPPGDVSRPIHRGIYRILRHLCCHKRSTFRG